MGWVPAVGVGENREMGWVPREGKQRDGLITAYIYLGCLREPGAQVVLGSVC